jgi:hypothetical protein
MPLCGEDSAAPEGPTSIAMGGSPWKVCLRLTPAPEGPSKAPTFHCHVSLPRPDRNFTSRAGTLDATSDTSASHEGSSGATYRALTPTMGFRPWLPTALPSGARCFNFLLRLSSRD